MHFGNGGRLIGIATKPIVHVGREVHAAAFLVVPNERDGTPASDRKIAEVCRHISEAQKCLNEFRGAAIKTLLFAPKFAMRRFGVDGNNEKIARLDERRSVLDGAPHVAGVVQDALRIDYIECADLFWFEIEHRNGSDRPRLVWHEARKQLLRCRC